MDKKIILVTGASSGIGACTAKTLADKGHKIILHGRDEVKTKKVADDIMKENSSADIDVITADLSLISEVASFTDKITAKYAHLDVLINNAGAQFTNDREVTSEGHEKTIAINTLAPFLITNRLLPLLKKSKEGRVVTVSSASYSAGGDFDPEDIEFEKNYSLFRSYGLTKRYVYWVMLKYHQLDRDGITFNCVEPGSAMTGLARNSAKMLWYKILGIMWIPMMWSIDKAAATSIYMATSDEVKGISGEFYGKCQKHEIKDKFRVQSEIDCIWDYCNKVCAEYLI